MTLILADELRHVTQSRIKKFRPNRFRSILPVDSSVPTWADTVQHSQISLSGEDPVRVGNGPVKNLPRPTISKADASITIVNFGLSYGYSNREMEKAEKQGIRLSSALASANQQKVERFFDAIAAGEKLATLGTPGLLNVTGITPQTAALKGGGATTVWTDATFDEIVSDIAQSIELVNTQTLENMMANLVILPLASYWLLTRTLHSTSSVSALALLKQMFPGVRFESWNRLATADAAGTGPRMVTMATGEDVARMIIPQELTDDQPIRVPGGVEIAQFCSTAGVLVETPDAIVYTDGI